MERVCELKQHYPDCNAPRRYETRKKGNQTQGNQKRRKQCWMNQRRTTGSQCEQIRDRGRRARWMRPRSKAAPYGRNKACASLLAGFLRQTSRLWWSERWSSWTCSSAGWRARSAAPGPWSCRRVMAQGRAPAAHPQSIFSGANTGSYISGSNLCGSLQPDAAAVANLTENALFVHWKPAYYKNVYSLFVFRLARRLNADRRR